jgi:hypothetical protein
MTKNEKIHFDKHYQQLLKCLKLQGKADKTIDAYSRAIRRVVQHFDCLPESLTPDNLKDCFASLVESHSWSTVKIDRLVCTGSTVVRQCRSYCQACSFIGNIFLKKTGSGLILLIPLKSKPFRIDVSVCLHSV